MRPSQKKRFAVAAVEDRRCAPIPYPLEDALGQRLLVCEVPLWIVARRASDRTIARELLLIEEPPAQLDLLDRQRVLFRNR